VIRVGDRNLPWREGMTVLDLLEDLGDDFPYPVVRINKRYISRPNFKDTIIPDETEIFLIQMIAGG